MAMTPEERQFSRARMPLDPRAWRRKRPCTEGNVKNTGAELVEPIKA